MVTVHRIVLGLCLPLCWALLACSGQKTPQTDEEWQAHLQELLINAKPGSTVELPEGTFLLSRSLTMEGVDNVVIRGKGMGKTILNFAGQTDGAEGIKIVGDNITIEDLTIQNAKGDGLKMIDSEGVVIRRIRVQWTQGPNAKNGAYGLYPVNCNNILIEDCEATDASDAGLYLGQSKNGIIRNNKSYNNVQGISVENCTNIQIYGNKFYGNTAGMAIINLPNLPTKNGDNIYAYNNEIYDNNRENFGAEGAIVSIIPAGTGMFVLAGRNVHVYKNQVRNHKTASSAVLSFLVTGRPMEDPAYDPFCTAVSLYENSFEPSIAQLPDTTRPLGRVIAKLFGTNSPAVMHDGIWNPELLKGGQVPADKAICIRNNEVVGEAAVPFANINAPAEFKKVLKDTKPYDCELPNNKATPPAGTAKS
jgi:parallel beta-helix repeat protein